jgi:UDP-N-acetylglucosamine acyltransferase
VPSSTLHPTAVVDSRAVLDLGVEIGPYAVIGPHVTLGAGTTVGAHAVIDGHTTLGRDCRVFPSAMIGQPPQDLKFRGERTFLRIGDRTVIREFATLNLATMPEEATVVGCDCLLMAYTHVAHNCVIGDHVILANAVNLAGHVTIEDHAIIGGVTPVHQFVRIGCHSFVGGGSRIPQDVAPYTLVAGNPARLAGLNRIGLERRGFSPATLSALKQAFRIMFRSRLTVERALARARAELPELPEVTHFLDFFNHSRRGVSR